MEWEHNNQEISIVCFKNFKEGKQHLSHDPHTIFFSPNWKDGHGSINKILKKYPFYPKLF